MARGWMASMNPNEHPLMMDQMCCRNCNTPGACFTQRRQIKLAPPAHRIGRCVVSPQPPLVVQCFSPSPWARAPQARPHHAPYMYPGCPAQART